MIRATSAAAKRRRFGPIGVVRAAVGAIVAATTVAVAVPVGYLAVLTVAGLPPHRRRHRLAPPETRFAILVPAHDEEAGIAQTLASFDALDYPAGMFEVHVVADNCTDETAAIVRGSAWAVHERSAPDDPGKGPALNWLYDRLVDGGVPFDAVAVVDADTTLDTRFLTTMDDAVRNGAVAAQGHYSVRGAEATPATSFRFAALACRHHLRPLGRSRLGGSCGLYGNGMVFTRAVLADRRWSGHLVEDAEFQNELLLDGHLVTFVPDASLWAEMPRELEHAVTQNERWERGRLEMARRYVPRLISGFPTARGRRLATADAILDHLVPPLSALAALQVASTCLAGIGAVAGHRRSRRMLCVNVAGVGVMTFHVVAGLASVGAPASLYVSLLSAPKQILWKLRLWASVLRSRDDVTWTRTRRNMEVVT